MKLVITKFYKIKTSNKSSKKKKIKNSLCTQTNHKHELVIKLKELKWSCYKQHHFFSGEHCSTDEQRVWAWGTQKEAHWYSSLEGAS